MEPENITGGVGYRYVGLYGSLIKALFKHSPESKVFWYSQNDRSLRIINKEECIRLKKSMLDTVINAISDTFKNKSYLAIIIAYPSVVTKNKRILEYILCLSILKIISMGRVRVFIDDFDLAVELKYAFSETKPSTATIIYNRMLEMLTVKLASFIITVSESYRQYFTKIYRINKLKVLVVSNGSLIRYINYIPPKSEGPLTVLYSGSAMKVKDVDKLVTAVTNLRGHGLKIELHIAGTKLMDLPDYVHVDSYSWQDFIKNVLSNSDIGVIPYPTNKLHFSNTMLAKPFDYMAAGKPIISTNLKETGNLIRKYNCGLVAKNWKEFELNLETLYYDRDFAKKLGENGRRAVEKYFNYELLAETLLQKLMKTFKS